MKCRKVNYMSIMKQESLLNSIILIIFMTKDLVKLKFFKTNSTLKNTSCPNLKFSTTTSNFNLIFRKWKNIVVRDTAICYPFSIFNVKLLLTNMTSHFTLSSTTLNFPRTLWNKKLRIESSPELVFQRKN